MPEPEVGVTKIVSADEKAEKKKLRKGKKQKQKEQREIEVAIEEEKILSQPEPVIVEVKEGTAQASNIVSDDEVPVASTAEEVLIASTFISLSRQIDALLEQREALFPYVTEEVAAAALKKRRISRKATAGSKKRKMTAYLAFFKEIKKGDPKISMKDAGARWTELKESEKDIYQTMADKENTEIDESSQ